MAHRYVPTRFTEPPAEWNKQHYEFQQFFVDGEMSSLLEQHIPDTFYSLGFGRVDFAGSTQFNGRILSQLHIYERQDRIHPVAIINIAYHPQCDITPKTKGHIDIYHCAENIEKISLPLQSRLSLHKSEDMRRSN